MSHTLIISDLCIQSPYIIFYNRSKAAKEGNLTKTEIPAKVYLDGKFESGWLPESGLVTDAFKLKRKQLNEHYKAQITALTK